MSRQDRIAALLEALSRRVLVLDGATGTAIQAMHLTAEDFGGPQYEGCNEHLVITRPAAISSIHEAYLDAGADIIETNTFGATRLVLGEYELADQAEAINLAGARLARAAADSRATPGRPRWVAGSMGPTTRAISVTGGISFEELVEEYYHQARALHEGGVDYLLLETAQDTRNVKAGLLAIQRLFDEGLERLPVAVSGTIEPTGTMLGGQTVEALANALEHLDLLYLGLNCATGPELMTDHVRSLAAATRARVAVVPNAGLPDEDGAYLETPAMLARALETFGRAGWINLVGGCCGTNRHHIAALAEMARGLTPRVPPTTRRAGLSGVEYLEVTDENRPVIVGERTNVLGSKKFRELISAEKFDEASDIARSQVKRGAQVIDVSTQQTDRDEVADLRRFLDQVVQKVRVPLMIDSTNEQAIAAALTYCQGKSIINSINLEDGERRFEQVSALARRFGAALVVGSIDERGQAITAEQKLEVARRSYELLTGKYGMAPEDLYFDPLVFPCASGDVAYLGSATQTVEAVRAIKAALPRSKTVLGISNISFGLPSAGREVVNSVFLYHCVQAGLDMALVNAEKLHRYPSIAANERELAEAVLFGRGPGETLEERTRAAITAFAEYFREKKPAAAPMQSLPLDERLARYIIEGSKDGLFADLDEKLKSTPALQIINGPLMAGMDEVGKLFNANQLIVAEVLQSAEAMKAAVSHLEPFMAKADSASRGKILLATVKGDVHDIGKNLVDIVLSNNGFQVINLGIKVPPAQLIEAVREHAPDMIGLSGLLVKSAHQMVTTAEDLSGAGIEVPMLVGGAALSRNFVDRNIAAAYQGTVAYASDAMSGLDLARRIADPERHVALRQELLEHRQKLPARKAAGGDTRPAGVRSSQLPAPAEIPAPPDFERHVITNTPLDAIWKYINPTMLYGRHLGLKGTLVRRLDELDRTELASTELGRKGLEVRDAVDAVKQECRDGLMKPRAVFRFLPAESEGDRLKLFDPGTRALLASFELPRQPRPDGLCLADYVSPAGGPPDNLCLFVTTAGDGVRAFAEKLKEQGEYLRSHILQALALETAEAYAELLHAQIRSMWGAPDSPELTMIDRFKANYRGKRYSFGYPACPRLDDQEILFRVLRPEDIGVRLTDGFMMDPEASVSALVFHHPQASYFSVQEGGAAAGGDDR